LIPPKDAQQNITKHNHRTPMMLKRSADDNKYDTVNHIGKPPFAKYRQISKPPSSAGGGLCVKNRACF
jgi:hypothetical protein